ncbi:hypothetical protein C8R44DRAFT_855022 [Mycena epipterygia]|nr:hypothetical protein C8R44DRAFT_855022 [Mycena epipterygia]
MNEEVERPAQVAKLWFPRDTIVIQAEDKLFQVSSGVLAARSTVFRDMIAFPQPTSDDTELVDGSPVVHLHDSAEDVTAFLSAIFDSSLLGILRLANKYDVQYLYRRALTHLAAAGWYTRTSHEPHGDHTITPSNATIEDALSITCAVAEVGALWLLPWAYYTTTTFAADHIIPVATGKWEQYGLKCLACHAHMVRGTVAVNEFLASAPPCATQQRTAPGFLRLREAGEGPRPDLRLHRRPRAGAFEKGMCAACCVVATERHAEALSTFWEGLPRVFGLPPWAELHAMQKAAMREDNEPTLAEYVPAPALLTKLTPSSSRSQWYRRTGVIPFGCLENSVDVGRFWIVSCGHFWICEGGTNRKLARADLLHTPTFSLVSRRYRARQWHHSILIVQLSSESAAVPCPTLGLEDSREQQCYWGSLAAPTEEFMSEFGGGREGLTRGIISRIPGLDKIVDSTVRGQSRIRTNTSWSCQGQIRSLDTDNADDELQPTQKWDLGEWISRGERYNNVPAVIEVAC